MDESRGRLLTSPHPASCSRRLVSAMAIPLAMLKRTVVVNLVSLWRIESWSSSLVRVMDVHSREVNISVLEESANKKE